MNWINNIRAIFALFLLWLLAVPVFSTPPEKEGGHMEEKSLALTSPAFKKGELIPVEYTCDSTDYSPELIFHNIPEGTKSLALICDDPDAPVGTWVHWVVFNISANMKGLPKNVVKDIYPVIGNSSSRVMVQGINDFKRFGYGGPCPPRGKPHRYFFKLYALDTLLEIGDKEIEKGVTSDTLQGKMKRHIIGETNLVGLYSR